ncbi:MAG: hypothetical protein GTO63_23910 [Anaerolineae bacterium]|nr:hypothetical protein [Anaerolineae bacterium]NIN98096.1 hypothetical protein [Anaerolineae bacterium]NIQ80756.1 hypothetical protein [Anaerolineae bacterium]
MELMELEFEVVHPVLRHLGFNVLLGEGFAHGVDEDASRQRLDIYEFCKLIEG